MRVDDRHGRVLEALRISRDERLALRSLGGRGADRALEIAPGQGERSSYDGVVHGGDAEDAHEISDDAPGESRPPLTFGEVEDGRHAMGGHEGLDLAALGSRPDPPCGIRVAPPVEEHVEQDVPIDEQAH
jgi:hypothetical protein